MKETEMETIFQGHYQAQRKMGMIRSDSTTFVRFGVMDLSNDRNVRDWLNQSSSSEKGGAGTGGGTNVASQKKKLLGAGAGIVTVEEDAFSDFPMLAFDKVPTSSSSTGPVAGPVSVSDSTRGNPKIHISPSSATSVETFVAQHPTTRNRLSFKVLEDNTPILTSIALSTTAGVGSRVRLRQQAKHSKTNSRNNSPNNSQNLETLTGGLDPQHLGMTPIVNSEAVLADSHSELFLEGRVVAIDEYPTTSCSTASSSTSGSSPHGPNGSNSKNCYGFNGEPEDFNPQDPIIYVLSLLEPETLVSADSSSGALLWRARASEVIVIQGHKTVDDFDGIFDTKVLEREYCSLVQVGSLLGDEVTTQAGAQAGDKGKESLAIETPSGVTVKNVKKKTDSLGSWIECDVLPDVPEPACEAETQSAAGDSVANGTNGGASKKNKKKKKGLKEEAALTAKTLEEAEAYHNVRVAIGAGVKRENYKVFVRLSSTTTSSEGNSVGASGSASGASKKSRGLSRKGSNPSATGYCGSSASASSSHSVTVNSIPPVQRIIAENRNSKTALEYTIMPDHSPWLLRTVIWEWECAEIIAEQDRRLEQSQKHLEAKAKKKNSGSTTPGAGLTTIAEANSGQHHQTSLNSQLEPQELQDADTMSLCSGVSDVTGLSKKGRRKKAYKANVASRTPTGNMLKSGPEAGAGSGPGKQKNKKKEVAGTATASVHSPSAPAQEIQSQPMSSPTHIDTQTPEPVSVPVSNSEDHDEDVYSAGRDTDTQDSIPATITSMNQSIASTTDACLVPSLPSVASPPQLSTVDSNENSPHDSNATASDAESSDSHSLPILSDQLLNRALCIDTDSDNGGGSHSITKDNLRSCEAAAGPGTTAQNPSRKNRQSTLVLADTEARNSQKPRTQSSASASSTGQSQQVAPRIGSPEWMATIPPAPQSPLLGRVKVCNTFLTVDSDDEDPEAEPEVEEFVLEEAADPDNSNSLLGFPQLLENASKSPGGARSLPLTRRQNGRQNGRRGTVTVTEQYPSSNKSGKTSNGDSTRSTAASSSVRRSMSWEGFLKQEVIDSDAEEEFGIV